MSHVLTYGDSNHSASQMAVENFTGTGFHPLSFACTPIELISNDGEGTIVSHATGFFWRHHGRSFLVTNWHVLSGRDIFTGDPCSSTAYIPRRIRYYGSSIYREGDEVVLARPVVDVCMEDDLVAKIEHKGRSEYPFDICALPIPEETIFGLNAAIGGVAGANLATCYLNENETPRIITHVGDDCFLLGYPLRSYAGFMPPIWKRGSIASEPLVGVNGRPVFLVDAATSSGMSGSPIVRRVNMGWQSTDAGDRELYKYRVIGVYGGRVAQAGSELHGAGYGWYSSLINKVIEGYFP